MILNFFVKCRTSVKSFLFGGPPFFALVCLFFLHMRMSKVEEGTCYSQVEGTCYSQVQDARNLCERLANIYCMHDFWKDL